MSELDAIMGSKISLISQQDIRYEGVLYRINAEESSIILSEGIALSIIFNFNML